MSRGRKPQPKSLTAAADAVFWRSTVLLEILDGYDKTSEALMRAAEPMRRLRMALEDFEVSRQPGNGHAQLELQP